MNVSLRPPPVADVDPERGRPNGASVSIPPEVRAALRALLAQILVADYRAEQTKPDRS